MRKLPTVVLATAAAVLAFAATATADWTAPQQIGPGDEANQEVFGVSGGRIATGWLGAEVSLSFRGLGDDFGRLVPQTRPDPFEKVWQTGMDRTGRITVVTVRKHKPTQAIRVTESDPLGPPDRTYTISDRAHSAAQPVLDVAPDGSAIAAWQWHDKGGWRVQAAIRRWGQPRFEKAQTISPPLPGKARPWIHVAAGEGVRGVVTWQHGGSAQIPEAPLHVMTTAGDGLWSADQELPDAGGLADVALAVSRTGEVQVAYLDQHFSGNEGPSSLRVSHGAAGAPLSAPVVVARGGKGTSSGPQVVAGYADDGTATVAWGKPGRDYEGGGTLEAFTRPPGVARFGAAQTLAQKVEGLDLDVHPDGRALLAWMRSDVVAKNRSRWSVHASRRRNPSAGFEPEETISSSDSQALWPAVAMTEGGEALATWVTNQSGGGSGQVTASIGR